VSQLIMVADSEYHASRIYESLGFSKVQTDFQLSWYLKQ
jgi:hypothetical protein